jgi:hypothetical protein
MYWLQPVEELPVSSLKSTTSSMIEALKASSYNEVTVAKIEEFVYKITFAEAESIRNVVRDELDKDWMAMPVWARNLAFRLACLQRPDDPALLREAAADLVSFGPDWDTEAGTLRARADTLGKPEPA